MLYQLGRVLNFNQSEWGYISYEKNILTVYNLKEKNKVAFKLDKSTFDRIYSASSPSNVSEETVNFALKESLEKGAFIKSLKAGVKFIGNDNQEYTLLKVKNDKIEFYKGKEEYKAKIGFIKNLTGDFDDDYINHLNVVTTKKEFKALTNEEKVKIAINYLKGSYSQDDKTEFEILEIGNIISGYAFYHEVDKYYELIGLQIKFKYKFDFQKDFTTEIGFFPIYIGRIPSYYPISFEESFGNLDFTEHRYENGLGDNIEVDKILIKKSVLDKIDFNK